MMDVSAWARADSEKAQPASASAKSRVETKLGLAMPALYSGPAEAGIARLFARC